MNYLHDYKNVGVFTTDLAIECKGDPFREVSDIFYRNGLESGTEIRISEHEDMTETKTLVVITVP